MEGQCFCRKGQCSLLSVIYEHRPNLARMPLALSCAPSPPSVAVIKVPASFSGMAGGWGWGWNVGIPDTQLPWPGAHKLSKPPGQGNRPPVPSHARVLKQAAGLCQDSRRAASESSERFQRPSLCSGGFIRFGPRSDSSAVRTTDTPHHRGTPCALGVLEQSPS